MQFGWKIFAAILVLLTLAGCQSNPASTARVIPLTASDADQAGAREWGIARLNVSVPLSLTVSEENTIKPRADIVWREDPCCDRHAQVDNLMTEALASVLTLRTGPRPVAVTLQVTRFHALTQRTRYSIGGEHEVVFVFDVRDAETGQVLRGPEVVDLTFTAAGGDQAIANEARGFFQRQAIQARLRQWAIAEFGLPAATPTGF